MLLEIFQRLSQENQSTNMRFGQIDDLLESFSFDQAKALFTQTLETILQKDYFDPLLFTCFDFIVHSIREKRRNSQIVAKAKLEIIPFLLSGATKHPQFVTYAAVCLKDNSKELNMLVQKCVWCLQNGQRLELQILREALVEMIADCQTTKEYNPNEDILKRSLFIELRYLMAPLRSEVGIQIQQLWCEIVTNSVKLIGLTHNSAFVEIKLQKSIINATISNVIRSQCDKSQITQKINNLLSSLIKTFNIFDVSEIFNYISASVNQIQIRSASSLGLLETAFSRMSELKIFSLNEFLCHKAICIGFIDLIVPQLLSTLTYPLRDLRNLNIREKQVQLIIQAHKVSSKPYTKDLSTAIDKSQCLQNSLLLAINCLYEEYYINDHRSETEFLKTLELTIDFYVDLIRREGREYFIYDNENLCGLADFVLALKVVSRFGITIMAAYGRMHSLTGNLFRLAIKGVLPEQVSRLIGTIVEERNKLQNGKFFGDFEKKVYILFQEARKNVEYLEKNFKWMSQILRFFLKECEERMEDYFLPCSKITTQILLNINPSPQTLSEGSRLIANLMDREISFLCDEQIDTLRELLRNLMALLLCSCSTDVLEIYLQIMNSTSMIPLIAEEFIEQSIEIERCLSIRRETEGMLFRYRTGVFILKRKPFSQEVMRYASAEILKKAGKENQERKIKSLLDLLIYLASSFYAEYHENEHIFGYNQFLVGQMAKTELILAALEPHCSSQAYICLRSLAIMHQRELAKYYRFCKNEDCSTRQSRKNLFASAYSRFTNGIGSLGDIETQDDLSCSLTLSYMMTNSFKELTPHSRQQIHEEILIRNFEAELKKRKMLKMSKKDKNNEQIRPYAAFHAANMEIYSLFL